MRFGLDHELPWGVLAVAAMTGVWLANPGDTVERAREAAFETVAGLFPRGESAGAVAVVDIDRESLAEIGAWPWRRSVLAELVDVAAAARPRAIGIDILLAGKDRKGPAALAAELQQMTGAAELDATAFADDDQRLARSIAAAGNVVLGLVLDDAGTDPTPRPAPLAVEGSAEGIVPRSAEGIVAPYPTFAVGAAAIGVLSFQPGTLGRVTSAPLIAVARRDAFAGFALETVRVAEGSSLLILKDDPNRIAAGSIEAPVDARGEMRLHLSPDRSWASRTVSAATLLGDAAPAQPRLAGKLVLIGSSAPEAGAFLPVAGGTLVPTVQLQAEAIDQMLTGRFLARSRSALAWEHVAMATLGLAAVALAMLLSPGWAALAALSLALGWCGLVAAAFVRNGLLLDPIGPAAAALVAANVTAFAAFVRTRALKTAIVQKFERYVPPEVVARLMREPRNLRLDGEMRDVTALVTDVEGFSAMTESSDPQVLVRVLDAYFDRVTELIVAHGGMVDKIVGDGVLAFFNIPTPLAGHTHAAVRCAGAILAATEVFRGEREAASLGFGRTRCGIETGRAIVGDIGGDRRLDYTAYGVVVNNAARFEAANKALHSSICIGPAAARVVLDDIPLRPLGAIAISGMQGTYEVFEPWRAEVAAEIRAAYAEAVALAATDRDEARRRFEELATQLPNDPVIGMWRERLAA